jgi:predicted  nucleic acid-binding Zn-ribbon protein
MPDWVCTKCGTPVEETPPEVRPPCPVCGTTARTTFISSIMAVTTQIYLKTRTLYRDGGRKVVREVTEGASYFRAAGRWDQIFRLIDRGNNWYREIFRDGKTGGVVHEKAEPLTEHRHKPKPPER